MKIVLLGTGTPSPSLERQSSGYLVRVGDDTIVFDHGPGAHHRLLESGERAVDVTHAFFSHLHYDHCLDYPRLVLQRWDQGAGEIPELRVYGPPPLARMSEQLFSEEGVFAVDIRARIEHQSSIDVFESRGGTTPRKRPAPIVSELLPGQAVNGDAWQLTVGHAAHVQPYLECLAFRLDSDDGSLCYSGDSGMCDELIELARGCDVLVQMNHFFSGREPSPSFRAACGNHIDNAELAKSAGVGTVVLTHIHRQMDSPELREQASAEMRRTFEGQVVWGEDLMVLTIDKSGVRVGSAAAGGHAGP